MKIFTIKMEKETHDDLKAISKHHGITMSKLGDILVQKAVLDHKNKKFKINVTSN